MRKLFLTSKIYMIAGLIAGLFYREFTVLNHYSGETQLSVLHTHTLILGMFFFLIVLLVDKIFDISTHPKFSRFFWTYNVGLILTLLMMVIHGVMAVLGMGSSAAISGIAGLGHIIITVGLVYFFKILGSKIN